MKYCEPPYNFKKTQNFLADFCVDRGSAVGAVHKQSGKIIGYILFNEYTESVYEMGWFFNWKYWQNGYAYEACQAVIDHAFTKLKLHKILLKRLTL